MGYDRIGLSQGNVMCIRRLCIIRVCVSKGWDAYFKDVLGIKRREEMSHEEVY